MQACRPTYAGLAGAKNRYGDYADGMGTTMEEIM